jgi:protein NrfC
MAGNITAKRTKTAAVSRRDFMKNTGTIILVAGSAWLIPVHGLAAESKGHGIPVSDGYLLVDLKKCQGCASCMLACSLVHEGVESLSLSRIQIIQNSFEAFPGDVTISQCRQCVQPECVAACPEDALTADKNFGHVRMIDLKKCIGCGACVEACPFTPARSQLAPHMGFSGKVKARKCDLCSRAPFHWDPAGGGPKGKQACVSVCPVEAIKFTKKVPLQEGDAGYQVNLRGETWKRLGFPID